MTTEPTDGELIEGAAGTPFERDMAKARAAYRAFALRNAPLLGLDPEAWAEKMIQANEQEWQERAERAATMTDEELLTSLPDYSALIEKINAHLAAGGTPETFQRPSLADVIRGANEDVQQLIAEDGRHEQ